jgi:hypothetical protein
VVENIDRGAFRKSGWVRTCLTENPPYRVLPAAIDTGDLRCQIASLLRLRPSSGLRSILPRPQWRLELINACRQLASAMPLRCFPILCPPPPPLVANSHPPVSSSPPHKTLRHRSHPWTREYLVLISNVGQAEREILAIVCTYFFSKPPVRGLPTAVNRANRTAGTFLSPLPYQAWHGYGVISAYRAEVELYAEWHPSSPPSGAAAAAPPIGAARGMHNLQKSCAGFKWSASRYGRRWDTCQRQVGVASGGPYRGATRESATQKRD